MSGVNPAEVIAEHTVRITADGKVEMTCHGDSTAACHQYPDCECESGETDDHQHPFVAHDQCWMQYWFDNDDIDPSGDVLELQNCDYTPGMQGPIAITFCHEYIEWAFLDGAGVTR